METIDVIRPAGTPRTRSHSRLVEPEGWCTCLTHLQFNSLALSHVVETHWGRVVNDRILPVLYKHADSQVGKCAAAVVVFVFGIVGRDDSPLGGTSEERGCTCSMTHDV